MSSRVGGAADSKESWPKACRQSGWCAVPTSTTAAGKALSATARSSNSPRRGECRAPRRPYRGPPAPAAWTVGRRSGSDANTPSGDKSTVPVDRLRYPTRSTMPRSSHERHAWKCSRSDASASARVASGHRDGRAHRRERVRSCSSRSVSADSLNCRHSSGNSSGYANGSIASISSRRARSASDSAARIRARNRSIARRL